MKPVINCRNVQELRSYGLIAVFGILIVVSL